MTRVLEEFPKEMFSSDIKPYEHKGRHVTVALWSTEILIMGSVDGKMQLITRMFLDGNYINCWWHNAKIQIPEPAVVLTLKELIEKYDHNEKKLNIEGTILERGFLEFVLDESAVTEEVAAFEREGQEFMLVLWKPCVEYFDEENQILILLHPKLSHDIELEDDDITYQELIKWGCNPKIKWVDRVINYLEKQ